MTVKSSIATAGYRCEIGSLLYRGDVPHENATVVDRMKQAGALILGTTNCPEFLMAYETANLLHGRTNNPWDFAHSPGGSSGGESAAIAAGMSAGGLGSDRRRRSVRVPAHFTGICSLKPTPGRIPGRGHLPPCVGPFSTLGAIGPMARTIADVALFFRTLSGQDPLRSRKSAGQASETSRWKTCGAFPSASLRTMVTIRLRPRLGKQCKMQRGRSKIRASMSDRFAPARWRRHGACGGSFLSAGAPCFSTRW